MARNRSEKGQALVLIVFGIVAMVGIIGLSIDGGNAYSDRRNAQNAADTAALAGALSASSGQSNTAISNAAKGRSTSNGYDGTTNNTVTVTIANSPSGACANGASGKDVTVQVVSNVHTYFADVMGIQQMTNTVSATARACISTYAPLFNGNAVVGLAPSGTDFSAQGTPTFTVTGGGIFGNSSDAAAASCGGNAGVVAPSVTVVGGSSFGCHTVSIPGGTTTGASQYTWSQYQNLMPPTPACNGTATQSGGQWYPQAGKNGSNIAWSGDMNFTAGLYCVTNSPGSFHGSITGANGVTFYMTSPSFNIKLNGGGSITAAAPTTGPYAGVLIYMAPQVSGGNLQDTQSLDLRGNGTANLTGSILAPSADITMYGNSGTGAYDSQVVGYTVSSGGNANINVTYNPNDNYKASVVASLALLK